MSEENEKIIRQKIRKNVQEIKKKLNGKIYSNDDLNSSSSTTNFTSTWCIYLLASQDLTKTYCGATNNFINRYRKHLQFLKGGAVSTKRKGILDLNKLSWYPICIVSNCLNQKEALQIEYRLHRANKRQDFRQWKEIQTNNHSSLSNELSSSPSGIRHRLLGLLYFILDAIKKRENENKSVVLEEKKNLIDSSLFLFSSIQINWFQPQFRSFLWNLSNQDGLYKEKFINLEIFDLLLYEHLHKKLLVTKTKSKAKKPKKRKIRSNEKKTMSKKQKK